MSAAVWTFTRRKRLGRHPEWSARCVGVNGEKIARLNQWYSRRIDAVHAVLLTQGASVRRPS